MTILGLALIFGGVGFLCWLLFALAIYVLPAFVGLSVGALAFKSGAGYGGAFVVALVAGAATFALGKSAVAATRSPALRTLIGAIFALPAAMAGYQAIAALAQLAGQSGAWIVAFGCIGAVSVGLTAWLRLSGASGPPVGPPRSVQPPQSAGAARSP
jgi:hypothetical protein